MLDRRTLLGISAVCAANLLLEVTLTRIFSALMFYHFTFFAIALALLGMGASGVYVYVRSERFPEATAREDLARNARRFAAATLLTLVYVLANPVNVWGDFGDSPHLTNISLLQLALLCAVAALPFFYAGMVVSLAITHFRRHIDRVYFFDLAGAGLAALVVGIAIRALGGPGLVVAVAFLACLAGVLFAPGRRSTVAAVAAFVLLLAAATTGIFDPPATKNVRAERVVFDEWNTFSHITVERMAKDSYDIRIDAAARTHLMYHRDAAGKGWESTITAFAYHFHPGGAGSVLIIGPGGGVDVTHALASGAKHVLGVEINPLIADDVMRGQFERESGGLYRDPRVTIAVDEGRSFVRRSPDKYDVIQATLVDTWAATASGAFALTENTLYTVEAFQDYLDHVTDDGVVTMSRWWTYGDAHETLRLVMLAAGALETRGIAPGATRQHLLLVRKNNLGTLLVKRNPFTAEETTRMEATAKEMGYDVVLSPATSGDKRMAALVDAGAFSRALRDWPVDLRPPTDDRPFFFYNVKPNHLFELSHFTGGKMANPVMWLLGALTVLLVALTGLFIFVPLLKRWSDLRGDGGREALPRRLAGLGYFAVIGFAFMVLEIALMQRLSLFLGHPSYSLIVVLFAILCGTALGARASRRFTGGGALAVGLALAALAVVAGLGLAPVLRELITLPLFARMAIAAAVVLVFGLAMGVMLPLGVRLVAERDAAMVPWAWGVNGGTSVIGTVGATIIAINGGFTATFMVAAGLYALAGGLAATLSRLVAHEAAAPAEPAATAHAA